MQTHPIGKKEPNTFGLFDMFGNVPEWCHYWHAAYPLGLQTYPTGPNTGVNRVFRGASYRRSVSYHRAPLMYNAPLSDAYSFGFRLARSAA